MNKVVALLVGTLMASALYADGVAPRKLYAKKCEISLSSKEQDALGEESLANLPVLVRLSTAIPKFTYADFKEADGTDMVFTDGEGNVLSHEIDTWDTTGESLVWVKLPSLSANSTLTLYFGGPKNESNVPADTWSAYKGVWHMNDVSDNLVIKDSAGGTFDGTVPFEGSATAIQGPFGGAAISLTNAITIVNTAAVNEIGSGLTIRGWFRNSGQASNTSTIFNKQEAWNAQKGWALQYYYGYTQVQVRQAGLKQKSSTFPSSNKNWNYVALTFVWGESVIYINGSTTGSSGGAWLSNDSTPLALLGYDQMGDEFRLAKGTATALYTSIEYQTMADANFLEYSPVSNTGTGLMLIVR